MATSVMIPIAADAVHPDFARLQLQPVPQPTWKPSFQERIELHTQAINATIRECVHRH